MAKITYENKVALNVNSDIADINKVTASDLNEIKNVVNTNDDNTTTNTNNIADNAAKIGTLSNLNTTNKNNLVSAINEVNTILGTIIESGTNSNGTYIKYSNGVMMCHVTKDFGKVNISNKWGTMYDSTKLQLGDFPQPFVGNYPDIFIMPWASFFVERNYSPSLTSFGAFWASRPDSSTVDVKVSCFAIGKWK